MATERRIEVKPNDNLQSVVYTLLAAKARGENAYCIFDGLIFHANNVTMESAELEVFRKEYRQKEMGRKLRECRYKMKVAADRERNNHDITLENVVAGLKFIAENPSMPQEELVDGLLSLGCNFTLEDIDRQFPKKKKISKGMKKGDLACGASVIVRMRDSEGDRLIYSDRFLSVDDSTSIYNFIRVASRKL